MKKVIASAAILVMFLTGCGSDASSSGDSEEAPASNVVEHSKIIVDGDTDVQIYVFTTNNGIKCVFADGDQESGLACSFGVDTP